MKLLILSFSLFRVAFFFFFWLCVICLAVPGLSCSTWKLRSALWRVESLLAAHGILDLCAGLFSCGMLTLSGSLRNLLP